MTNDQSAKSRKKKKKGKKDSIPAAVEHPKFTSKAVESDDHYVVFEFQQVPPGTPAPVTPSPVSAPSPNDYDQMLPSNLPVPADGANKSKMGKTDHVEKSLATPSKSAQNWDTPSAKSQKKKKKSKKEAAPAAVEPPKFTSKAVESDDHYVVFEFQPVAPGTPAPVTPSPVSAPSPNDYDQMLPSNLPVPADGASKSSSPDAVEKSSAIPLSGKKQVKKDRSNEAISTKSRKRRKGKKDLLPTPPFEDRSNEGVSTKSRKKTRKKKPGDKK